MDYPLKTPLKGRVIIVKVSEEERQSIKDNAVRHTKGNVSQWIRKASISFDPGTDDSDDAVAS